MLVDGLQTSVQPTGQPLEGLRGAKLLLSEGKKTFTLPSGAVKRGTYTLDAAQTPKRIDATTEGRRETAKGIYAVKGETLTMCLSRGGTRRPAEFATKEGTDFLLIVLARPSAKAETPPPAAAPSAKKPSGSRTFRMGFTGFVYDITLNAVVSSRKFVRENGDILAHHIEGVPWAEAFEDRPFPKAMLEEWEGKRSATPPRGKVYLAISPGRGDLKVAEKAAPLPAALRGKSYDDPLVEKAYLNYCRRNSSSPGATAGSWTRRGIPVRPWACGRTTSPCRWRNGTRGAARRRRVPLPDKREERLRVDVVARGSAKENVAVSVAGEPVASSPANQQVASIAAEEHVVASAARKDVVAATAGHEVIAADLLVDLPRMAFSRNLYRIKEPQYLMRPEH
jgi:uncharacterized protein (TIGR03067 family)